MTMRPSIVTYAGVTRAEGTQSGVSGLPPFVALNAVSASANSPSLDCGECHMNVTMVAILAFSVAPTAMSTQLQGSLDNVNWYNIGAPITSLAAGNTIVSNSGIVFRYVRATTTITGGTSVSLTAQIGVGE